MTKARKTRRAKKGRPAKRQRQVVGVARDTTTGAAQPEPLNFAEEYQYVIADLKRIFILAAAMFVVLIVLAVALR